MEIKEIFYALKNINKPTDNSYNVFQNKNCYYGVNSKGHIVFLIKSQISKGLSSSQQTSNLFLGINMKCILKQNDFLFEGIYDILVCYENNDQNIISFLQLTNAYCMSNDSLKINIKIFFESLKNLFSSKQKLPYSELQGLFGELYFIDYIDNANSKIDIVKYWQSRDKMKFDFSINNYKKIEIKTTTKDVRIHKFRHEQLVSDIYDTWIVSIMLQRDDQGFSLYELSEKIKNKHSNNLNLNIKISTLLSNYTKFELDEIRYNIDYLIENMRFFRTKNIPKFAGRQPQGVSNAEYDSDLSTIKANTEKEFLEWMI